MKSKTRSLLEELEYLSEHRDTAHIIENRANNVISSAIHLLEMISRNYAPEKAAVLERRLLNAIKARDKDKFARTIRKKSNED